MAGPARPFERSCSLYKVVAIGEKDFCAGFALAGIETRVAPAAALAHEIERAIQNGVYGLVIIDEQANDLLENMDRARAQIPIVIPVPGRMQWHDVEQLGEDQHIAALIRQAVGYQLDLQL